MPKSVIPSPSSEHLERFRRLLSRLYDDAFLQTCQLARELLPDERLSARERSDRLRTAILRAVEEMSPGLDVPLRSSQGRSYNVLHLHYVEGLMVRDVARELAISERQVYRDLRTAEARLWQVLRADLRHLTGTDSEQYSSADRAALVHREAERLSGSKELFGFRELLAGIMQAISPLAQKCGLELQTVSRPGLGKVMMDRQIARHALLLLLSHVLQNASGDAVSMTVVRRADTIEITLDYTVAQTIRKETLVPPACKQLLRHLGSHYTVDLEGQRVQIHLLLHDRVRATVLVIDDNAGLVELFGRYLEGEPFRLLGAQNGAQGLRLVEEQQPAMVILDVMMPEQDGWETLQYLKHSEETRRIPVIVCSVLDDPELAFSLGASEFLAKPVSREALLACLRRSL